MERLKEILNERHYRVEGWVARFGDMIGQTPAKRFYTPQKYNGSNHSNLGLDFVQNDSVEGGAVLDAGFTCRFQCCKIHEFPVNSWMKQLILG